MSSYRPIEVTCKCGEQQVVALAATVNASRSPLSRKAIIDGTFHRFECTRCSRRFTVEAPVAYVDFARGSFFRVLPRSDRHLWRRASAELVEVAGRIPRTLLGTAGVRVRLVVGLAELREKLLAEDASIDDRRLEMLKVLVVAEHPFLLQRPRLQLVAESFGSDQVQMRASFDHDNRHFRITLPRPVVDSVVTQPRPLHNWLIASHGDDQFLSGDHPWASMWRFSPQPSALEQLHSYAEAIAKQKDVDTTSNDFSSMLKALPRGSQLPDAAKADLRTLVEYAKGKGLRELESTLFEIRFNFGLSNEWGLAGDINDVTTLWQLLQNLPPSNVEGNADIHEIFLDPQKGGGSYDPQSHDIHIGEQELDDQAGFASVVRHEIGHAVEEKAGAQIRSWVDERFGWSMLDPTDDSIDAWVAAMGGWGAGTADTQIPEMRGLVRQALGNGERWDPPPAPNPPAGHPWWAQDCAPRKAYEQTQANWYQHHADWLRNGGKAFFTNFWYATLASVHETTLEFVARMPSDYASMSSSEFFAELYRLFFDLADPHRSNIPADVLEDLKAKVGPIPAVSARPAEPEPIWHRIRRPVS